MIKTRFAYGDYITLQFYIAVHACSHADGLSLYIEQEIAVQMEFILQIVITFFTVHLPMAFQH